MSITVWAFMSITGPLIRRHRHEVHATMKIFHVNYWSSDSPTSPMNSDHIRVEDYILFLPEYCVLLCRSCKHAIRPKSGIQTHFQTKHQAVPIEVRKLILDYAEPLELKDPEDVDVPDFLRRPIVKFV